MAKKTNLSDAEKLEAVLLLLRKQEQECKTPICGFFAPSRFGEPISNGKLACTDGLGAGQCRCVA